LPRALSDEALLLNTSEQIGLPNLMERSRL
jgi:hypothetical protein